MQKLYWNSAAFKDSTNFEHIKTHYYWSHIAVSRLLHVHLLVDYWRNVSQVNPTRIVPVGPIPHILPLWGGRRCQWKFCICISIWCISLNWIHVPIVPINHLMRGCRCCVVQQRGRWWWNAGGNVVLGFDVTRRVEVRRRQWFWRCGKQERGDGTTITWVSTDYN